jgi:hypothetical protein
MSEENKDRIIQDFATNLIRLGNECRDHALENARLKAEVERRKMQVERLEENTMRLSAMLSGEFDKVDHLKAQVERLTIEADWKTPARRNKTLEAEVERLKALFTQVESCRYNITCCKRHPDDSWGIPNDWRADSFNLHLKTLKEVIEKAKGVQS